jgi:predicted ATPase
MELMTDLDTQAREVVLDYLSDEIALSDLRRSFRSLAWQLNSESVVEANPSTAQASLWLAEFTNGHREEGELRDLLAALVATVNLRFGDPDPEPKRSAATATPSPPAGLLVGVRS